MDESKDEQVQAPTTTRAAAAAGTGPDASAAVAAALDEITATLGDAAVTVAVVFLGSAHAGAADAVRDEVAARLAPDLLVGTTAQGVIAGPTELETGEGVSIWAAALPGATARPVRLAPAEAADPPSPTIPDDAKAMVLLADPFSFPADAYLEELAEQQADLPVMGGLASGAPQPGGNRLLLDDRVHRDGAVAVVLGGAIEVTPLVSQGCRPVGPAFTITDAEDNVIKTLAGRPALERLEELYAEAGPIDQVRLQAGLHIGMVIDEYATDHDVGDFLVRGVMAADRDSGAVAVGEFVEVGQTVRFQVRDADAADEDLRRLLATPEDTAPDAALLFTCNGRGSRLFGTSHHDAELVHETLGNVPLAGFFAAGEIGPVGTRSHLHGFTASVLAISAAPVSP